MFQLSRGEERRGIGERPVPRVVHESVKGNEEEGGKERKGGGGKWGGGVKVRKEAREWIVEWWIGDVTFRNHLLLTKSFV